MVKVLYIELKQKNLKIDLPKSQISKLPEKLLLVYSLQYKEIAEQIKKQLLSNKIKIQTFRQVLGCTKINNKNNLPVLLVSTGRFHAENLMLQTSELYVLENNKIIKIPEKEFKQLKIKRKTALLKFLSAETVGILVSTKPGQENLSQAVRLKQKLEKNKKQQKQVFIFISDNIDVNQFENFNIDCWINTACPGLAFDNQNIMNYLEICNL